MRSSSTQTSRILQKRVEAIHFFRLVAPASRPPGLSRVLRPDMLPHSPSLQALCSSPPVAPPQRRLRISSRAARLADEREGTISALPTSAFPLHLTGMQRSWHSQLSRPMLCSEEVIRMQFTEVSEEELAK